MNTIKLADALGIDTTCKKYLKDYFECYKALEEIEEFCLVYRDNPVEGSAYKKILDIITKEKEQE